MARLRTLAAAASLGFLLVFAIVISLGGDTPKRQVSGQIIPTSSMNVPRSGHTATLLRDGTVLIAGGMLRNGDFSSTAEIFDPKTNQFSPVKDMLLGRVGAAAAVLPSGKVLIVGGWYETDEAEIYDPATRSFAATGRMSERRARPTATVLRDGTVLITGGSMPTRSPGVDWARASPPRTSRGGLCRNSGCPSPCRVEGGMVGFLEFHVVSFAAAGRPDVIDGAIARDSKEPRSDGPFCASKPCTRFQMRRNVSCTRSSAMPVSRTTRRIRE